ncbi:hypothetical protein [Mangrovicella endophytica]|uniref:hypothetical protein n=1 Tax=Mangrovicella endophytica TaxID=2066697 RepID=UPI0012FFDB0E|nr:hypothetical protein [Mangrovicella endophytica]
MPQIAHMQHHAAGCLWLKNSGLDTRRYRPFQARKDGDAAARTSDRQRGGRFDAEDIRKAISTQLTSASFRWRHRSFAPASADQSRRFGSRMRKAGRSINIEVMEIWHVCMHRH